MGDDSSRIPPRTTTLVLTVAAGLLVLSACAPRRPVAPTPEPRSALPSVPARTGSLTVELAYPPPGAPRPPTDSTFVYGSVGTGTARLLINGFQVPLAANGAFLTYLPVPEDGRFRLIVRTEDEVDRLIYEYGNPVTGADVRPIRPPRSARVITGRDTLDTGSEIVAGRNRPGGDRRWFFPRGTLLTVSGKAGSYYRVQLTPHTVAWTHENNLDLGRPDSSIRAQAARKSAPSGPYIQPYEEWVDLRLPIGPLPFRLTTSPHSAELTIYGDLEETAARPFHADSVGSNPFIEDVRWRSTNPDSAVLHVEFGPRFWGYKAFHDSNDRLTLRLRRPPLPNRQQPSASSEKPLAGLRIAIDPGHPPSGTYGPTGLLEPEANLAIARHLADTLAARGAEPLLSRTSKAPMRNATWAPQELWARTRWAVREDADLLVSIHNNALPAGVNPMEEHGSLVYYFHGFAEPLAETMLEEIAAVTRLPNSYASRRSLALTRPTWMPAVLTESLYMMYPQQEAALENSEFLGRLARAHANGIERFVRGDEAESR